jgi:MoaA/NifB/PqqE/SkfB family radical SAM enzyme
MQALSICVVNEIPFTLNMVVTAQNRHELDRMAQLATRLGSRGLRFGHLMPAPLTTALNCDLSPWERKVVEAQIRSFWIKHAIPIAIAPGYHTTDLFPCRPLRAKELNVDCHGNLTKCCHLSGHGDGTGQGDVIGSLYEMSFAEVYGRFLEDNQHFHREKTRRLVNGEFQDSDFFPCWYCSLYYEKVDWLNQVEGHPWTSLMWMDGN